MAPSLPEIPNYEIKRQLAKGGMATVYEATHLTLKREIALKVMSSEISGNPIFRKRFTSEARIAASLKHPHIIHIYDTGISKDQLYITMELLTYGSLKDLIERQGKLAATSAIAIMEQLTSALSYAHNKGFIHRDVKPANILFKDDSSAVLADFGIAKIENSVTEITRMGLALGSPHYMPPEQALGERVSISSDIYSLGIVFYEMLTGEKPYTGENTLAVTYAHAHKPIPELPNKLKQFQPILNTALAKHPEHRFESSDDFMSLILRINLDEEALNLSEKTVFHPPPTHDAEVTSHNNKNKLTGVFYFFLLIALVTSLGFWFYSRPVATQAAPPKKIKTPSVEVIEEEKPTVSSEPLTIIPLTKAASPLHKKIEPAKKNEIINEEYMDCILEGEDDCERFKE